MPIFIEKVKKKQYKTKQTKQILREKPGKY